MIRQKYNIALIENHFVVKMAYLETIKGIKKRSYQRQLRLQIII